MKSSMAARQSPGEALQVVVCRHATATPRASPTVGTSLQERREDDRRTAGKRKQRWKSESVGRCADTAQSSGRLAQVPIRASAKTLSLHSCVRYK